MNMDELERQLIRELHALQSVPVPEGCLPGKAITYAEHRAGMIRDKLNDLEAYRQKRDGDKHIYQMKWLIKRCTDCGFWFSHNRCKVCNALICGICADWSSPRLYSPGKGMCTACRERPSLPVSPYTGEQYDPAWGIQIKKF